MNPGKRARASVLFVMLLAAALAGGGADVATAQQWLLGAAGGNTVMPSEPILKAVQEIKGKP